METWRNSHKKLHKRLIILGVGVLVALILAASIYFRANGTKMKTPYDYIKAPLTIEIPVRYELSIDMGLEIVKMPRMRITCYTNRVEECDSTPNIGASERMVYEGSCAVSQDLFRKKIHPGDILYVEKIDRYFLVEDTMHKRHKNHVDLFIYKKNLKAAKKFGCQRSDVYVISTRR